MNTQRYLDHCPIACGSPVSPTDIILEQGCLERCNGCHQLFSQCTKADFNASMEEFNTEQGTWPPPENVKSLERNTKKTLQNIQKLTGKEIGSMKLLDVGCSNGAFIYTASRLGMPCDGIEPAAEAARAAQKAGLNVVQGFVEDSPFDAGSYDVITLLEVIEHLENPVDLLKACHRLLKKDGIMVIRTANTDSWTVKWLKGQWHYFSIRRHGGHISFFCRRSIQALCQATDFTIARFDTHSVTLCEKQNTSFWVYRSFKVLSELLNLPAKLAGKGQEMEVYLKKIK